MSAKALFLLVASVLLIQTVYGLSCALPSSPQLSSQQFSCGSNFGSIGRGPSGFQVGGIGGCSGSAGYLGSSINQGFGIYPGSEGFQVGALEVVSGSPITPDGFRIIAENLEMAGPVTVIGNLPFAGAVDINGALQSGGAAIVQYSTLPGSGLSESGCGLGLGSNLPYTSNVPSIQNYRNVPNFPNVPFNSFAPVPSGGCGCNRY